MYTRRYVWTYVYTDVWTNRRTDKQCFDPRRTQVRKPVRQDVCWSVRPYIYRSVCPYGLMSVLDRRKSVRMDLHYVGMSVRTNICQYWQTYDCTDGHMSVRMEVCKMYGRTILWPERKYVCMYVCTYLGMYIHKEVHMYGRTYVRPYRHTYVRLSLCTYVRR